MVMTDEEIAIEFRRRFPHDCFVMAVEMSIEDILKEIRRIEQDEKNETPKT